MAAAILFGEPWEEMYSTPRAAIFVCMAGIFVFSGLFFTAIRQVSDRFCVGLRQASDRFQTGLEGSNIPELSQEDFLGDGLHIVDNNYITHGQ